jgi:hypothetical protein
MIEESCVVRHLRRHVGWNELAKGAQATLLQKRGSLIAWYEHLDCRQEALKTRRLSLYQRQAAAA